MNNRKQKSCMLGSIFILKLFVTGCLVLCVSCTDSKVQTKACLSADVSWPSWIANDIVSVTGTASHNGTFLAMLATESIMNTKALLEGEIETTEKSCDLTVALADSKGTETVYRAGKVPLTNGLKETEEVQLKGQAYITSMISSASFAQGESIGIPINAYPEDAAIHYTTDGSDPTKESTLSTGPIPLTGTTTIKAIVIAEGYTDSEIASGTYTQAGTFSITIPVSSLDIAIVTDDYRTYVSIVRGETGMGEKQYSWYLNGVEQAEDNQDSITLSNLTEGKRYRIMVKIRKGEEGLNTFSTYKYFTIPEGAGVKE